MSEYEEDEEEEEKDKEEVSASIDEDDVLEARFFAILQRSKERQNQFKGKASEFEELISEMTLERKDHWRSLSLAQSPPVQLS